MPYSLTPVANCAIAPGCSCGAGQTSEGSEMPAVGAVFLGLSPGSFACRATPRRRYGMPKKIRVVVTRF
jgi:hypothetical protein